MSGRFALLADLAFKHVTMRRRQTLVAISGAAGGAGFLLAVSAMMIGSQAHFTRVFRSRFGRTPGETRPFIS